MIKIPKPNGIALGDDGTLYIASFSDPSGKIYKYRNGKLQIFVTGGEINGTDGVFYDRRRGLILASGFWAGNVVVYDKHGDTLGIIRSKLRHPADIYYDIKKMFVFVPDMGRGKLLIYKISDDVRKNLQRELEGTCSSCGCKH